MENLETRINYNEANILKLEKSIEQLDAKIENTEKDIMKKVEENQRDIKLILKENEERSKQKTEKLFDSVSKLTESQYQQTMIQKDIQNDLKINIRDFTELATELKDNDKWKNRTIIGLGVSVITALVGALIKFIIPAFIYFPFF